MTAPSFLLSFPSISFLSLVCTNRTLIFIILYNLKYQHICRYIVTTETSMSSQGKVTKKIQLTLVHQIFMDTVTYFLHPLLPHISKLIIAPSSQFDHFVPQIDIYILPFISLLPLHLLVHDNYISFLCRSPVSSILLLPEDSPTPPSINTPRTRSVSMVGRITKCLILHSNGVLTLSSVDQSVHVSKNKPISPD